MTGKNEHSGREPPVHRCTEDATGDVLGLVTCIHWLFSFGTCVVPLTKFLTRTTSHMQSTTVHSSIVAIIMTMY